MSTTTAQPGGATRLALARLAAYAIDWMVFAAWGALVFAAAWSFRDGDTFAWPSDALLAQVSGFLLTTLPLGLYFALCEGTRRRATIGKRVLGLRVRTAAGDPPTLGRSIARTAIKLLPWEAGHTAVYQSMAAESGTPPTWSIGLGFAATVVGATYVVMLWSRGGATPYDRLAATRVTFASVSRSEDAGADPHHR